MDASVSSLPSLSQPFSFRRCTYTCTYTTTLSTSENSRDQRHISLNRGAYSVFCDLTFYFFVRDRSPSAMALLTTRRLHAVCSLL